MAGADVVAAHEVPVHVVEHLIAVDVAVIVGCGDGFGVIVVEPWAERTHDKGITFEGLMHGGRLMHTSCYRLEIVDAEGVGIVVTVPGHHIEGVRGIDELVHRVLLLHLDEELTLLIVRFEIGWPADVALTEGRMLQQLPEPVAVALGRVHRAVALHYEQAVVLGVEIDLIDHAPRDEQIIPISELQVANQCAQRAAPFVDEDHLVRIGILVEVVAETVLRCREDDLHIAVDKDRLSAIKEIGRWRGLEPMQPQRAHILLHHHLGRHIVALQHLRDLSRPVEMVEQAAHAIEAHRAEQLLVVVAAVRLLEYRVPLVGHVAEGMIDGHFPVLGLQMYGLGMGRQLTVVSLLISLIPFFLISKASSLKIQSASLHTQVYLATEL